MSGYRLFRVFPVLSVCCVLAGCFGGGGEFQLHAVTGKVTKAGAPLKGVTISLIPVELSQKAPPLIAVTGEDGSYSIRTISGETGAPEGNYKIVLAAPAPEMDYSKAKAKPVKSDLIPKQWTDAATTDQTILVKSGPNVKDFVIN